MIFGDCGRISVQPWHAILNDSIGEMREVEKSWLFDLLLLVLVRWVHYTRIEVRGIERGTSGTRRQIERWHGLLFVTSKHGIAQSRDVLPVVLKEGKA